MSDLRRWTTAPVDYDYSGTITVNPTWGRNTRTGDVIREIKLPADRGGRYQEPRYASGLYPCWTEEKLNIDLRFGNIERTPYEESQERLLRALADQMGFQLRRKPQRKK